MTEEPSDANSDDRGPESSARQDETVQLLDILVLLARGRRLLVRTVVVFVVLAVAYGLFASPTYRSTAWVVPEAQSEAPQSLPGLGGGLSALQGLGINLGGLSKGLSTDAYPEILKGREVRRAVVRDTFRIPTRDTTVTLVDYYVGEKGGVKIAVETLKDWMGLAPPDSIRRGRYPTWKEEAAMRILAEQVTAYNSPDTGLMKISVETGSPTLSVQVVNSFVEHLSSHVHTVRTRKARQNVNFIRSRFEEAQEELSAAEEKLANFLDRNQSISTAKLRTARERLERQVQFKTDLYSELQAQLTQAEIDLKRSEPVITVVEEPVPPLEPTSPQRVVIVILSLFGGLVAGSGLVLLRAFFREEDASGERQAKIREVREAFYPERLASALKGRFKSSDAES